MLSAQPSTNAGSRFQAAWLHPWSARRRYPRRAPSLQWWGARPAIWHRLSRGPTRVGRWAGGRCPAQGRPGAQGRAGGQRAAGKHAGQVKAVCIRQHRATVQAGPQRTNPAAAKLFCTHTHTHTPRSWQTLATWQLSCWPGRRGSPDTGPASRALQHSEAWEGREKQAVTCFY